MSSPAMRRSDKQTTPGRAVELLAAAYCGRLATISEDGSPYISPLLYVWADAKVWVHTVSARGHFRSNVDREPRVCFEIDVAGAVYPYGRFMCDTALEYQSVLVFGRIAVVEPPEEKARFFDALMLKYGSVDDARPKSFYPRLDGVTVYCLTPDRITGKETTLPAASDRWPSMDRTKSPEAVPPEPAASR